MNNLTKPYIKSVLEYLKAYTRWFGKHPNRYTDYIHPKEVIKMHTCLPLKLSGLKPAETKLALLCISMLVKSPDHEKACLIDMTHKYFKDEIPNRTTFRAAKEALVLWGFIHRTAEPKIYLVNVMYVYVGSRPDAKLWELKDDNPEEDGFNITLDVPLDHDTYSKQDNEEVFPGPHEDD